MKESVEYGVYQGPLYTDFLSRIKRVKRGRKPIHQTEEILELVQEDLKKSPFRGEGHRKVLERLRRAKIKVGRNRLLCIMREHQLLSPHRSSYRPANAHDGRISTDEPNMMRGSDGTKIKTTEDGWVWVFSVIEHWNSECMGWHVSKTGNRFEALEPVTQAIRKSYGGLGKDIAKGLKLRIDNGSQYTSDYFLEQVRFLGVESSFGLVRQPETNGVSERFHRTLKEQILGGRIFKNAEELREAMRQFVKIYNEEWLVAKRGYKSPLEARDEYKKLRGVA